MIAWWLVAAFPIMTWEDRCEAMCKLCHMYVRPPRDMRRRKKHRELVVYSVYSKFIYHLMKVVRVWQFIQNHDHYLYIYIYIHSLET